MDDPIRVLVVEDSDHASRGLAAILSSDPEIEVVGFAHDGIEALARAPVLKPDLVAMDVSVVGMNGLATVEQLMAYHPTPVLVVSASLADEYVELSMRMLAAGALEVIGKPRHGEGHDWERDCEALIQRVKLLSRVRVVTHLKGRRASSRRHYEIVAVASSTGGPQALLEILRDLPPTFATPVLIVQHIAAGFTGGLAGWLAGQSGREVRVAEQGERPAPGVALLAPDNRQMLITNDGTIMLSECLPGEICPNADAMMCSVAEAVSACAVGVILTGMGSDGADGLRAMRLAGAYTIAQDEATSIVFGMPRAAIRMGIVDEVLPLEAIAAHLAEVAGV